MVHPAGCLAADCRYLYFYDEDESGRRFMGCLNNVFRVEIDVEVFREAERTRHGFGGVKLSGRPMPQCRMTVERAYDGHGDAFECINLDFFRRPTTGDDDDSETAFDLRDSL
ncbi:MAG: hypothetical protein QOJ07_1325 [Thermoleophilaceae bacterium]|nr:hypothetical protein [Thermoleophilaceae bacterium]